jgi:hypothetical protein
MMATKLNLPQLTNMFVLRRTKMIDEEESNALLRERYPTDDSETTMIPVFESEEAAKEIVRYFKEDQKHLVDWEIVPVVVVEID